MLAHKQKPSAEVLLLPSLQRWDKSPRTSLSNRVQLAEIFATKITSLGIKARVEMCEINWGMEFQGTLHTLRFLNGSYPSHKIVLLCGQDSLEHMCQWRNQRTGEINGSQIATEFSLWVVPRIVQPNPATKPELRVGDKSNKHSIEDFLWPGVHWLPTLSTVLPELGKLGCIRVPETLSSSHIRRLILQNHSLQGMTLPEIINFIRSG